MKKFVEMSLLRSVLDRLEPYAKIEVLNEVRHGDHKFPLYGITIGGDDGPECPTLGLFGGVHGLEKIGSHLVINYLNSLTEQLEWDETLRNLLKYCKIVSIPIINPVGMYRNWRSNGNGVDLMRNAPVETDEPIWLPLSGQSFSDKMPWFQGIPEKMEIETQTVVEFVQKEMFQSRFAMSLDVHSGFGMVDRLWHPYGKSRRPFADLGAATRFERLLDKSISYHVYKVEPQSHSYLIQGDMWDYLYDSFKSQNKQTTYLPWTLELGSWVWVKKNPRQALSLSGFFNPILPHRYKRTMRRHRGLLDLMLRATYSFDSWNQMQK